MCYPRATPTENENGLPEGKPLKCLVAGVRNLSSKCFRNALTRSVKARTVSVNGEGSFNPSAPARLDVQPLAIP